MQTLKIREAAPPRTLAEAVEIGNGYVIKAGVEMASAAQPLIMYPNMKGEDWYSHVNARLQEIPSVGCVLVSDATVYGAGQVSVGGSVLLEGNEQDAGLTEWHQNVARARKPVKISAECVSFIIPGYIIWGHWLAQLLPRLFLLRSTLKERLGEMLVLMPNDTPAWAFNLIKGLIGQELTYHLYDPLADELHVDKLWIPTAPYSGDHHFHSAIKGLYETGRPSQAGTRRLYLSRRKMEMSSRGVAKRFTTRDRYEEIAAAHGFETIFPEELSFADQGEAFSNCAALIGEFGSGLHNSVFCPKQTIVGPVGFFNQIQSRLCALSEQRMIYLIPENEIYHDDGVIEFTAEESTLIGFFEALDTALKGSV